MITLQCALCGREVVQMESAEAGGIYNWYALCKDCYDKLLTEHDDHLYGSLGPHC